MLSIVIITSFIFLDATSISSIAISIDSILLLLSFIWSPKFSTITFVSFACPVDFCTFSFISLIEAVNSSIPLAWSAAPCDIVWEVKAICSEPPFTWEVASPISLNTSFIDDIIFTKEFLIPIKSPLYSFSNETSRFPSAILFNVLSISNM